MMHKVVRVNLAVWLTRLQKESDELRKALDDIQEDSSFKDATLLSEANRQRAFTMAVW